MFRPKYAYCLGTPPAVLGVPPDVLGLPPDVLGLPPAMLGLPPGVLGMPTEDLRRPTGPVHDPPRSLEETRWDRHQPALCSPHGQVPRPPTGKSRPPTGNSSESYIQAGSEVHPVGGRWEEVSTLRYSLINSSLTADATVDIVPMQEEQIYISIGETYPP